MYLFSALGLGACGCSGWVKVQRPGMVAGVEGGAGARSREPSFTKARMVETEGAGLSSPSSWGRGGVKDRILLIYVT